MSGIRLTDARRALLERAALQIGVRWDSVKYPPLRWALDSGYVRATGSTRYVITRKGKQILIEEQRRLDRVRGVCR